MNKIKVKGAVVSNDDTEIYNWLGYDCVSPNQVEDVLNNNDEDVEVDIASGGGSVFAASEIYTMLKAYAGKVVVNIQGLAASAASVIAMAGDEVNMYALAQLNGMSINTVIHPGQVLRVADKGQGTKVSNNISKPVPQKTTSTTWRDTMGDTWHSEKGTVTLNSWVNLRWGAKQNSSLIATLAPGSTIKYDAWSNHNGYTWIRQPRQNGYAYMAVRSNYTHQAFGTFK